MSVSGIAARSAGAGGPDRAEGAAVIHGAALEQPFGRILDVACLALDVSLAGVGLMDGARQVFVARRGHLPGAVPRQDTICEIAIRRGAPLRVRDASRDPRLCRLPSVAGQPHVRAYMTVPLDVPGEGTICVAAREPRDFSDRDEALLRGLARLVEGEIGLRHIALSDALTGLMSRRAWTGAARRAEALSRRGQRWSVLLLDLDRFKQVNDLHGHAAGDAVLQETARRVTSALRAGDAAGRIGGDEIAILVEGAEGDAARLAARLGHAISCAPIRHGDLSLTAEASMGWARIGPGGLDAAIEEADAALYRRKSRRRAA